MTAWRAIHIAEVPRLRRAELADLVGPWALVGRPVSEQVGGSRTEPVWSFRTRSKDGRVSEIEGRRLVVHDDDVVLPLRKRVDNFPSIIMIGRASSNDIELPHHTVSKLHARFVSSPDHAPPGAEKGEASIADAGSRNGTSLAGQRLEANVRVPVESGVAISFGSMHFHVIALADLVRIAKR